MTDIWKKKYEELLVEKVELEQQIHLIELKHQGSVSTSMQQYTLVELRHQGSVSTNIQKYTPMELKHQGSVSTSMQQYTLMELATFCLGVKFALSTLSWRREIRFFVTMLSFPSSLNELKQNVRLKQALSIFQHIST